MSPDPHRVIRSSSHPVAVEARALGRGPRERRAAGLFLVEGPRGLAEALDAGAAVRWVAATPAQLEADETAPLIERARSVGAAIHSVEAGLLGRVSPAEHGPGPLAACVIPEGAGDVERVVTRAIELAAGPLVVCWQLQNPGNLGAILRSAAAFGAAGLVAAGGSDPWNPKVVRASAGAIHRLAVARTDDPESVRALLERPALRLLAAVPNGGAPPRGVDWTPPLALLLGAEVAGLPADLEARATRVTIPTNGSVESLSVAIAGSILLSEAYAAR